MASPRHQRLARLLCEHAEALLPLFERLLGIRLPGELEVLQGPESIREGGSHDYLPDGTVLLRSRSSPKDAVLIVLEFQLGEDPTKSLRWPLYVAGARNRSGVPTILVVVTDDIAVARWASEPIDAGWGRMLLRPLVLGPEQIPRVVSMEEARTFPLLAVLAVVAHGRSDEARRIVSIAIDAVRPIVERGDAIGMLFMDVIAAFADEAVLDEIEEDEMRLEMLEPVSSFGKRHYDRGRKEGLRDGREEGLRDGREEGLGAALLLLLEARSIMISDEDRTRIANCGDGARLSTWIRRAGTAHRVEQVFDQ